MTELGHAQVSAGGSLIRPSAELTNSGSNAGPTGSVLRLPTTGSDSGNPFSLSGNLNFFAAAPLPLLDHKLWAGLGLTTPFGLSISYPNDWFGRYDVTNSDLFTLDIEPSVAYAFAPWISVGAGLDVQYANASLENAVPTTFPINPAADGFARLSGDDWSVGFHVGV